MDTGGAAVGQVKGSNFQAKFPKITYFHEGHRQTGCLSEDLQMASSMRSDIRVVRGCKYKFALNLMSKKVLSISYKNRGFAI